MIPVAEVDTQRLDLFWGTFRTSMRLGKTPGTCAAFFWVCTSPPGRLLFAGPELFKRLMSNSQYYNDTEEIDIEFLSKDFNTTNSSYPVNLVLQSRAAAEAGYNAQLTEISKRLTSRSTLQLVSTNTESTTFLGGSCSTQMARFWPR